MFYLWIGLMGKLIMRKDYISDGEDPRFSVKNYKVDYGEELLDANTEEFYNSEYYLS